MSTKITKEEILKIAGLAKLTVTAKEAEKLQGEIAGILDFVAQLKDVDVEGVNPTSHVGGVYNVLRGDDRTETDFANEGHQRDVVVQSFPDAKDDFLRVPSVLPEE